MAPEFDFYFNCELNYDEVFCSRDLQGNNITVLLEADFQSLGNLRIL